MKPISQREFYSIAKPLSQRELLKQFRSFLNPPNPLLQSLRTVARYHDEPVVYQFSSGSNVLVDSKPTFIGGMGTSFSEVNAQIKALGEAVERISLVQKSEVQFTEKATNLSSVMKLSDLPELYGNRKRLNQVENHLFPWAHGYALDTLGQVSIPAQLIFVPYKFTKNELVIRPPISTGTALGTSYLDAVLRGLLEIIERDAFILSYYQKTVNCKVDITAYAHLKEILEELERCKLTLHVFDISVDTGAYVFLSLVIDETGYGPPVSAGLKAGYDPYSTSLGAIEESLHSRSWIRDIVFTSSTVASPIKPDSIKTLQERALFWLDIKLLSTLDFYLSCNRNRSLKNYRQLRASSLKEQLRKQLDDLKNIGSTIYFVDLTMEAMKKRGVRSVKAIATMLQPLHLEEKHFPLSGPRLTSSQVLNKIPHFFL